MQSALIYCRVSDKRQVDEGNSLATQEKQTREYTERAGYLLDRVFVERGESAKTDDRKVLKEMLAYCQKQRGRIQVVVIPKIDRLSRNRDDYGALKAFLMRLHIRLESVGERIEDTPVGRFTESILASVAQFDNEIRSERCKGGMIEAVQEGRWVWKAPKGYQNVRFEKKGTIAPKEGEADLIREMFRRIASGDQSATAVRLWLGSQGLHLSHSTLHEMLRHKAYIGTIEAFGQVVRAKPPFLPLVSEATFYLAQQAVRRETPGFPYERINADFPLRGTLVCSCGKRMSGCWSQGRSQRYAYYRCAVCPHANFRTAPVEEVFRQELNGYRLTPAQVKEVARQLGALWMARGEGGKREAQGLEAQIKAEKELRTAIALKCAQGVIPDDVAREQMATSENRIAQLTRDAAACPQEQGSLEDLLVFTCSYLQNLGDNWMKMPLDRKRKLQSFLYPQGITYRRDGTLRTADYPLLDLLKSGFESLYPVWWTQADPGANSFFSFMEGLQRFSENSDLLLGP